MTQDLMEYPKLVEGAMRSVVREALIRAAGEGLPGAHHFYITFRTQDPGVDISDTLVARFPDEMTIVLENQFWGLEVADEGFTVTLSFGGRQERLVVPFAALTTFVDPSVKFGLQFGENAGLATDAQQDAATQVAPAAETDEAGDSPAETADAPDETPDLGRVVTLDQFRKK
jgi:hypothetical protein